MRRLIPIVLLLSELIQTAGCLSARTPACLPGEHPAVLESLYFGTAKPGGIVSPEEWTAFVKDIVTPAFPEGLTSWQASGQWRKSTGAIEYETSRILQLTHEQNMAKEVAIQRIMITYQHTFQQDAVMRVRSPACLSFKG